MNQNLSLRERGISYLRQIQHVVSRPEMVYTAPSLDLEYRLCISLGRHIDRINQRLNVYLNACHGCFYPEARINAQVWAVPLALALRLDALCDLQQSPRLILIDVGRVEPAHWLPVVAHEYAHIHVGYPGHHLAFRTTLAHLCLGLGLEPPPSEVNSDQLQSWPPYPSRTNPLDFWLDVSGVF